MTYLAPAQGRLQRELPASLDLVRQQFDGCGVDAEDLARYRA